ncbi:DUF1214 domain-containing protein [Streptomyces sp. NPDC059637]|uniref:DUF1214 domain-containing protein n=1 Tax=Streptomyces sp. NPDC059637 TaxID=3347752 RepID=UPI0036CC9E9E
MSAGPRAGRTAGPHRRAAPPGRNHPCAGEHLGGGARPPRPGWDGNPGRGVPARHVPAARFWSLTVYDNQTRSMLDTPQRFPRAGSQASPTPAAVPGPDGAVTVHFCPDRPDGVPEGDWIRTVPGRGWFVALRLYSPLQPFFDKTWRPGEIEEVGRSGNEAG